MKKSLIAMAVLGSFFGVAVAQSSVTVYGSIDTGIEKVPGSAARISQGISRTNRFGFRGVEDLGGGMQAGFILESGFNSDKGGFATSNGVANFGMRTTLLFLGHKDYGRLSFGRAFSGGEFVMFRAKAAPGDYKFGQVQVGESEIMATNVNSRYDNIIRYESPKFYGFSVDLATGLQGDAQSDLTRPALDAGVAGTATRNLASATKIGYTNRLDYENGRFAASAGIVSTPSRPGTGIAANSARADKNVTSVAASYDFGFARLGAFFENDARYTNRENAWLVSAGIPVRTGMLIAWYGQDRNGGATLSDALKVAQFGYKHTLSKRTYLYAAFANETVQGRVLTGANAGQKRANTYGLLDGTSTQIGLSHSF